LISVVSFASDRFDREFNELGLRTRSGGFHFRPPTGLFFKETPAIKVVVVDRTFDIIVQFLFFLVGAR